MINRFTIREAHKTMQSHILTITESGNKIKSVVYSKSFSIYIRIFINYTQILAIIFNLELKWPLYVRSYLQLSGSISSVNTQLFSLDCLINDYDLNIEVIYLKALSNILIYFGFLTAAVWIFIIKLALNKQKDSNEFIILAIVVSILLQPNSIRDTSDIFNCLTINQKYYLVQEMKLECYTPEHTKWVFFFKYIL